jgi:hypothetical protein
MPCLCAILSKDEAICSAVFPSPQTTSGKFACGKDCPTGAASPSESSDSDAGGGHPHVATEFKCSAASGAPTSPLATACSNAIRSSLMGSGSGPSPGDADAAETGPFEANLVTGTVDGEGWRGPVTNGAFSDTNRRACA